MIKMRKEILIAVLLIPVLTFAETTNPSTSASCTIIQGMKTFVPPIIMAVGFFVALAGIIMSFVEFVRRQIGWAGISLIGGLVFGGALYALSAGADKLFETLLKKFGCG